jgi:hypothetical protein
MCGHGGPAQEHGLAPLVGSSRRSSTSGGTGTDPPSPDDTKHYELTARGNSLRPVLEAFAVWGLGELTRPSPDDAFDAKWMALPLGGMIRPDRAAGAHLRVELVVDGDTIAVEIDDGHLRLAPPTGPADGPADVTIEGSPDALAAAVAAPGSPAAGAGAGPG